MRTHVLIAVAALASAAGVSSAQTGRYFLTDESGVNNVWQVQGGALVNTYPTLPPGPRMGPIIVDQNTQSVRYVAGGLVGGQSGPGFEHNFAGAPINGPLSFSLAAHNAGRVLDAGFDGTDAYVLSGLTGNFGGTATIYRYNGDFSGPGVPLFNVNANAQGMTFNVDTATFWTTDYDLTGGTGFLREWSLTGVPLAAFPVTDFAGTNSERSTALAYDQNDKTFWLNAHVENTLGLGLGELWQFNALTGAFMQKINPRPGLLYWGGEIQVIPAPAGLLLLAAAAPLAGRRRR